MELELGLKITHTRDDLISTSDLRITKDSSGPVFCSKETDTMFFLIIHLKGFRKENIDIQINERGNEIAISGKKPVQEMVLKGWIMCKKEVEIRAFKKVFRIPDGIILDKIKAKFNEEESTLKITMPKSVKGINGVEIEEVKEEEVDGGIPERERRREIESKEPETRKLDEIEQAVKKEVSRRYPDIIEPAPDKIPGKVHGEEEVVEPKTENAKEIKQDVKEAVDRVKMEATEEVSPEILAEAEIDKQKDTYKTMEEKVGDTLEKKAREIEEAKQDVKKPQEILESEPSRTSETVAPEKAEPLALVESKKAEENGETNQVHEKVVLTTEPTPSEKVPDTGERKIQETPKPVIGSKSIESETIQQSEVPSPSVTQVEEKLSAEKRDEVEGKTPEELRMQESKKDDQEATGKPETDQKPVTAVDGIHKTGGHEIEEEPTNEEITDQAQPPMEDGRQPQNGAAGPESEKPVMKKSSKICTPLVVAGSAILVSLIAIFVRLIRPKRR